MKYTVRWDVVSVYLRHLISLRDRVYRKMYRKGYDMANPKKLFGMLDLYPVSSDGCLPKDMTEKYFMSMVYVAQFGGRTYDNVEKAYIQSYRFYIDLVRRIRVFQSFYTSNAHAQGKGTKVEIATEGSAYGLSMTSSIPGAVEATEDILSVIIEKKVVRKSLARVLYNFVLEEFSLKDEVEQNGGLFIPKSGKNEADLFQFLETKGVYFSPLALEYRKALDSRGVSSIKGYLTSNYNALSRLQEEYRKEAETLCGEGENLLGIDGEYAYYETQDPLDCWIHIGAGVFAGHGAFAEVDDAYIEERPIDTKKSRYITVYSPEFRATVMFKAIDKTLPESEKIRISNEIEERRMTVKEAESYLLDNYGDLSDCIRVKKEGIVQKAIEQIDSRKYYYFGSNYQDVYNYRCSENNTVYAAILGGLQGISGKYKVTETTPKQRTTYGSGSYIIPVKDLDDVIVREVELTDIHSVYSDDTAMRASVRDLFPVSSIPQEAIDAKFGRDMSRKAKQTLRSGILESLPKMTKFNTSSLQYDMLRALVEFAYVGDAKYQLVLSDDFRYRHYMTALEEVYRFILSRMHGVPKYVLNVIR